MKAATFARIAAKVRLHGHVQVSVKQTEAAVAVVSESAFVPNFPAAEWSYLSHGFLVLDNNKSIWSSFAVANNHARNVQTSWRRDSALAFRNAALVDKSHAWDSTDADKPCVVTCHECRFRLLGAAGAIE